LSAGGNLNHGISHENSEFHEEKQLVASDSSRSSSAQDTPENQPGPQAARLYLRITGLRSTEGRVMVALFSRAKGFPEDETAAAWRSPLPISDSGVAEASIEGLRPGLWAITWFHDTDATGRLKTGIFGQPLQDYGFSGGVIGRFGPPSFGKAAIRLAPGENRLELANPWR
jgi:uncharacterized protein (DUF2141 family)